MAPIRRTSESVTLGHIRGHGCRDVLVYSRDVVCNHSVKMNADHLGDDTPLGRSARAWSAPNAGASAPKSGRTGARTPSTPPLRRYS
jgi:hypothetical protein